MQMKKIVAGTSAIALSLSMTSFALAATDNQSINLEVEVVDTLSMDCYDYGQSTGDTTVTLSDSTTGTGLVTAGVPSVGASTCDVTTNDDQGYYLTIERTTEDVTWGDGDGNVETGENGDGQYAGATAVLIHEDVNIDDTWYQIPDLTAYSYTALTPAGTTWTTGTDIGLGFSVVNSPDNEDGTDMDNNDLQGVWVEGTIGTDACLDGTADPTDANDTAVYAGVPASAETISAVPEYEASSTTTNVCYKVDVASTQQSGEYAGQVTFTATSDASAYLQ